MKKFIIITGLFTGFLLVGFISYQFGYYKSFHESHNASAGEWKKGIQTRTENYQPSCTELKNANAPEIVQRNNDYFFVHSSQNFFYVFGINIEPGKPPQLHWWGADSEEILKKCTMKQ